MGMIKRLEWNKKTATLVLGVVFTFSIVTVFLSGRGITIAENTTLDPVEWTFQRPNESVQFVYINDKLNATYVGDGLSANMYVTIGIYHENDSAYDGDDHLSMLTVINVTTSNPDGYIESVYVVVQKDNESALGWVRLQLQLENLSLVDSADAARWRTKAYIKLAGVNRTGSVHAGATAEWSLITPNTQSHQLEIAFEIVYYNGTAYNKVVQPFQLNIVGSET
ncbi:MAG: hypothetical protein OEW62_11215 [Candidatus Bathyarchaeota archaeon]|nr:hypothetical protein [Candidatus Bathyarchaeota archaeon]